MVKSSDVCVFNIKLNWTKLFDIAARCEERSGCSKGEQQEFLWGGETGASGRETEGGADCRGQKTSRGVHVRTHTFRFSERKMWWKCNISLWLFQCGLDASGLQRARDWQKDGGEEASQPGGQEKGASWETGNGPGNPEVATRHKTIVVTRNSCLG